MASIRKRTWKSKDGTPQTAWITDYFDQNGKRHIKTFATQRAARDWSTTVLHEVQQGTHTAASASITVGDLGKLWLEHCEAEGLERSTVRQRRQHLDLHITPFLGRAKLSDLTMPRIYKFDGELRKGGRSSAMRTKVITNVKVMLTLPSRKASSPRTLRAAFASRTRSGTPQPGLCAREWTSRPRPSSRR